MQSFRYETILSQSIKSITNRNNWIENLQSAISCYNYFTIIQNIKIFNGVIMKRTVFMTLSLLIALNATIPIQAGNSKKNRNSILKAISIGLVGTTAIALFSIFLWKKRQCDIASLNQIAIENKPYTTAYEGLANYAKSYICLVNE